MFHTRTMSTSNPTAKPALDPYNPPAYLLQCAILPSDLPAQLPWTESCIHGGPRKERPRTNPRVNRLLHVPADYTFGELERILEVVFGWEEQVKEARRELEALGVESLDGRFAWKGKDGEDVEMEMKEDTEGTTPSRPSITESTTLSTALGPLFPPVTPLTYNILPPTTTINPPTIHLHPIGPSSYSPPTLPVLLTATGSTTRFFRPLPPSILTTKPSSLLSPSTYMISLLHNIPESQRKQEEEDLKLESVKAYLRDAARTRAEEGGRFQIYPVPGGEG